MKIDFENCSLIPISYTLREKGSKLEFQFSARRLLVLFFYPLIRVRDWSTSRKQLEADTVWLLSSY